MIENQIAILLTCFNRKEKTLQCLQSIYDLNLSNIKIFLVDDGSTDGTSEEVKDLFPQVFVLKGAGNLFWNRGMLKAWDAAKDYNFDFYLWMNDDVELFEFAIDELFECSVNSGHQAIISGLIKDKESEDIIYGGFDAGKKIINPNGRQQNIKFLNGNVVLVPKDVYNKIGMLDPYFHHDLGDVEYGLRALKNNIQVLSTRRAVAEGYSNSICRERKNGVGLIKRFKILYSPLGSNPYYNFYFRKKYQSYFKAVMYFIFQHILNLLPDNLNSRLFGKKYT